MSDGEKPGAEKRKLGQNEDNGVGALKKAREENEEGTTQTDEEEVDEFFAILRRIHVAVNYFKKNNGEIRNLTMGGVLDWETTNVENNGVTGEMKGRAKNVDLDLNKDPLPDPEPL